MQKQRQIPDGFERIEHHEHLSLHDRDRGIIITVREIDETQRRYNEHSPHKPPASAYPYRVELSDNQASGYSGAFQSLSHAEDKALELANSY